MKSGNLHMQGAKSCGKPKDKRNALKDFRGL